jgi:hypothetical protein
VALSRRVIRLSRVVPIVAVVALAGCGWWQQGSSGTAVSSTHSPSVPASAPSANPTATPPGGPSVRSATVSGHVHWPDCPSPCPPAPDVPVHFSTATNTWSAVSDSAGAYTIRLPPGAYTVIAGNADRSPYPQALTVRAGDAVTLDLTVSPPTGAS